MNAIVYISGPISGMPQITMEEKLARFDRAEEWLNGQAWVAGIMNPLKSGNNQCRYNGECNPEGHVGQDGKLSHSWRCYLEHDIRDLLVCTHIALLPHWAHSRGARLERLIAIELGMEIIHLNRDGQRSWHNDD